VTLLPDRPDRVLPLPPGSAGEDVPRAWIEHELEEVAAIAGEDAEQRL